MFDILSIIPSKKRRTPSGWTTFNCVCCVHLGHKPDRRSRAGIKYDGAHTWSYNCFNCNFRCGHTTGKTISQKTRQLLQWCGIDLEQIQRWNLQSLENRDILEILLANHQPTTVKFAQRPLPEGSERLDEKNALHRRWIIYLKKRGLTTDDGDFYVTPRAAGRNNNRIIIPYTQRGVIVGHTSRYCDDRLPKYINDGQPGYVFGVDMQQPDWSVAIVVEGIFDALSIRGLAVMHNTVSPEQQRTIAALGRQIIVVPDRDSAGYTLAQRALEFGWSVSYPQWDSSIKDVNDAVIRYGRVPTLLSILQSATTSRVKVELQRRKLGAK